MPGKGRRDEAVAGLQGLFAGHKDIKENRKVDRTDHGLQGMQREIRLRPTSILSLFWTVNAFHIR